MVDGATFGGGRRFGKVPGAAGGKVGPVVAIVPAAAPGRSGRLWVPLETTLAAHDDTPSPPPGRGAPATGSADLLLRLRRFADGLTNRTALDDLLWEAAAQVGELFGYEDCVVYLVERVGLVQYAAFGVKNPTVREIKNRIVLPLGQGIVGAVALSGRPELVADTRSDARYIADEFVGRSELAVPIVYAGKVLGVLDSEASHPDGFTAADQAIFELLAALLAPRIASALAERELGAAIDDLARAESVHRDRIAALQRQRLESLGQLAGGIAHDFNNALTAILGNLELARGMAGAGPLAQVLGEAAAACERPRELARQLVAFASGGAPVLQPGDLREVLREAVHQELAGSPIVVAWHEPPEVPVVAFDRGQLRDAFRHVVRNARQAMAEQGTLTVTLRVAGGRERVLEVAIADSGPGVPMPLRAAVFDPYYTTKPGASGLGLTTAYWIVRRHSGALELDPATPGGARFLVTLPVLAELRRGNAAVGLRPLRLLVLDDDDAVRRVLTRMATAVGHELTAVAEGSECVREFAAGRARGGYDAVLLDLTLRSGIDWQQTLDQLRAFDAKVVVLAMSGYHDSPAVAQPRAQGFAGSLAKPFTAGELDRAVNEAIVAGAP